MIVLENVSKRYGSLCVYEHFDLRIEEGKITCILGASGCGKTTLLNMLAGLVPYEGSIRPQGLRCSYIFQQPRLVPALTVEGNLKLVCKDEKKISDMLFRLELADKRKAYPAELSGGQAQRVSIARAFLYPSDIILMDEPFASLDTALKLRLIDVFFDLWKEEPRTALFVTHDVEEAYILSHRAVVLERGRAAADLADASPVPRRYGEASSYRQAILSALLSGTANT